MSAQPPAKLVSPAGSSVGWSWRVWLARQKSVLKTGVALILAYLSSLVPVVADPALTGVIAFLVGLGSRAAMDRLDFWLSEVTLEPKP